jgi:hypothetical protein
MFYAYCCALRVFVRRPGQRLTTPTLDVTEGKKKEGEKVTRKIVLKPLLVLFVNNLNDNSFL